VSDQEWASCARSAEQSSGAACTAAALPTCIKRATIPNQTTGLFTGVRSVVDALWTFTAEGRLQRPATPE